MNAICQECRQPLLLQQTQSSLLRESYDNLEDLLRKSTLPGASPDTRFGMNALDEHQLYFFGLSGDAAEHSQHVDRELKVKDIVDASVSPDNQASLQLKYPVCLECLESIIKALATKTKQHEGDRDKYMRELLRVEEAIGRAG